MSFLEFPDSEARGESSRFTMILNDAIRDPRLSWRAKGVLAGAMSHNKGFRFSRSWFLSHGTEGRDAIVAALNELRGFGYLLDEPQRCKATGKISGTHLVFVDRPLETKPSEKPSETGVLENRTPVNQGTGKPDAGKPGLLRRPEIQENQLEKDQIQISPETQTASSSEPPPAASKKGRGRPSAMDVALGSLPSFAAPYRGKLGEWLTRREKAHKVKPEITSRTLSALKLANEKNVLDEFCDVIAERNWYSLGFNGYQDFIDQIAQKKSKNSRARLSRIAPRVDTNGVDGLERPSDPLISSDAEFLPVENLISALPFYLKAQHEN
jgi:hypothetical protein